MLKKLLIGFVLLLGALTSVHAVTIEEKSGGDISEEEVLCHELLLDTVYWGYEYARAWGDGRKMSDEKLAEFFEPWDIFVEACYWNPFENVDLSAAWDYIMERLG